MSLEGSGEGADASMFTPNIDLANWIQSNFKPHVTPDTHYFDRNPVTGPAFFFYSLPESPLRPLLAQTEGDYELIDRRTKCLLEGRVGSIQYLCE